MNMPTPHSDTTNLETLIDVAIADGGLPTDDVLAAMVPLIRQAIETHACGRVAPLEGLGRLQADSGRIFYSMADQQSLRRNRSAVLQVEASDTATIEITGDVAEVTGEHGQPQLRDQRVAEASKPIRRPVHINGFVTWEHRLEHHDPLTDVLSLGQLLASLACGIDFRDLDAVHQFAEHRGNLFAIKPDLHPAIARAIHRMTELHRTRRVQDLSSLAGALENYREASAGLDFDVTIDAQPNAEESRTTAILGRLRQRLFEITRRNRLLHFSPTMATINLTQASVPLALDPSKIDLKKLLIADDTLLKRMGDGKAVSLSNFINVQEVLYATSVFDRIITDERRDRAEYGFGGLRLAMAFLNWSNVKSKPPEKYNSPLVLVSVELKKKKGVRDTYFLEATDSDAEVNPVLRHLMRQLYAIELPETIPLQAGAIGELAERLRAAIAASDTSVELSIVERPQIELIRAKAQKRLQQYQRRARVSGRGVRHFGELQYSYDPANYHPLGVRLFDAKIRQPATNLEAITRKEVPPRRNLMTDNGDEGKLQQPARDNSPKVEEAERTFYRWKEGGSDNPYHWRIDLCNITLASFRYRRMSLVRDYDAMTREGIDNAAFDDLFSQVPRDVTRSIPSDTPVYQRWDVVPCDPTQALAIGEAREGRNYIVQGPPGTGKSQTITNLIADYVARGQRVLFVCEKRAAIDVVFARLKAIGLGQLCCLIHDAQADKKNFVLDLKATYETFLQTNHQRKKSKSKPTREKLAAEIESELERLTQVDDAMNTPLAEAGVSLMELIDRCIELNAASHRDSISSLDRERLPSYTDWVDFKPRTNAIGERLRALQLDGVLARHPLAILSCDLVDDDGPLARVTRELANAQGVLGPMLDRFRSLGVNESTWQSFDQADRLVTYAEDAAVLASAELLSAVEKGGKSWRSLSQKLRHLKRKRETAAESAAANVNWREKLSPADTASALAIARQVDGRITRFLNPQWWRLRALLGRVYDFSAHAIAPTWVSVLEQLQVEHDQAKDAEERSSKLQDDYGFFEDPLKWGERLERLRAVLADAPGLYSEIHYPMLQDEQAATTLETIAAQRVSLDWLHEALDSICISWHDMPFSVLATRLSQMQSSVDQVPRFMTVLESLKPMPERLSWALRRLPLTSDALEAVIADETYHRQVRRNSVVESFSGGTRSSHAARLRDLYAQWLQINSKEVLGHVAQQFLEHVYDAEDSSATSREKRDLRRGYQKGRRELEHEFGKQMRYKPIRSLLSGETRRVIVDLKPIWLMSPLSVSDTLPLDDDVDVVIFDEASQVTLEEAVPSLCRGRQVIVVGDQMQLPPSNFFSSKCAVDEDDDEFTVRGDEGEDVQYDLASASFLDFADRNLPSTMLGWHYRSRSESLISFSNWRFYNGRLLTVPEETLAGKPISFHFMEHGCYENRRNRVEAEHIATLVRNLLCGHAKGQSTGQSTQESPNEFDSERSSLPKHPTIGVIAFSEAQQSEIEKALSRLADEDRDFADKLDAEFTREDDGQFVGLLVKNLENIQGDERDVVIMSICYGPDPHGKMRMNFGPINKSGGEKRLNVAFSRAKHHMAIVTSIRHTAITNDYNTGAATLQDYLQYAEAVSGRRKEPAQALLMKIGRQRAGLTSDTEIPQSVLKAQVAEALRAAGWHVDLDIGQSHFRVDLAVRTDHDEAYRLGIVLDDVEYRESDPFERDVQRPELLRNFGWNITHVLAKDWFDDPAAEIERLKTLCK